MQELCLFSECVYLTNGMSLYKQCLYNIMFHECIYMHLYCIFFYICEIIVNLQRLDDADLIPMKPDIFYFIFLSEL